MWLLFGISAIIMAVFNVVWTIRHREAKWFRFISLSCTALTLCGFYSQANRWAVLGSHTRLCFSLGPRLRDLLPLGLLPEQSSEDPVPVGAGKTVLFTPPTPDLVSPA